jgi:glutathione S-transferase
MGDETDKNAYMEKCRELGGNITTNIPMLYIDGLYLTQSTAILRYVGRWRKNV